MTSTQPNIHNFFQCRRSSRNSVVNKKGIKSDAGIVNKNQTLNLPVDEVLKEKTPKRKRDNEQSTNKRRKQEDTSPPHTPSEVLQNKPVAEKTSACKKLEMTVGSDEKKQTKKKLSPQELKAKLGKCNRLDELRSRLVKATNCNDRLKAFQSEVIADSISLSSSSKSPCKKPAHPQLKSFTSLDVMVPVSPSASPFKSPLKTPIKSPAYMKYADLVASPSKELKLPINYGILKKMFVAMDRISSMLYNRPEIITFSKLKTNVQDAVKKTFNMCHLGQVKFVFPNAYKYLWEKIKGSGLVDSQNGAYQLVLQPILEQTPSSIARNLNDMFDNKTSAPVKTTFRKMNNIVLAERENTFHNLLVNILKQHHQEYLKSLDIPIPCDENKIRRWHPGFLQGNIPDVEAAELPKPPAIDKIDTAQDMLAKVQDVFSVNPRLMNAVQDAASKEKPKTPVKEAPIPAPASNPALKGISMSLLAKVRAREAEKAAKQMTRSKAEVDELERLSRLPEVARIIRNVFISEKKAALLWDFITAKLVSSHSSLISTSEVDVHLNLLIKEVPNWCTVHKIRSGTYLKIDKNRQLNDITEKLNLLIKQH